MNRESWLTDLVDALRPYFTDKGLTIPEYLRVSCSWPSRAVRKTWGQCWTTQSVAVGVRQLWIRRPHNRQMDRPRPTHLLLRRIFWDSA